MKMKEFNIFSYLLLITILPVAGWFLYIINKYPEEGKYGIWLLLLIIIFQLMVCRKISHKITEKNRKLEEINRHLNEVDRLKTEFLANVSHKLRTPLTVIMGYSELLLEQYVDQSADNIERKFIKTIYQKSEDLLCLINDLIELSHIESGKLEMYVEQLFLDEILQEMADYFSEKAAKKDVLLTIHIQEKPLIMMGDGAKVKQIMRHLIENGIKNTPEGGKISVRGYKKRGRIFVEVEDNGIDIARENFDEIYQPFKQGNGSFDGLGLTITKHLVKYHNGTMDLQSTSGEGCKFTLSFPGYIDND